MADICRLPYRTQSPYHAHPAGVKWQTPQGGNALSSRACCCGGCVQVKIGREVAGGERPAMGPDEAAGSEETTTLLIEPNALKLAFPEALYCGGQDRLLKGRINT